MAYVKKWSKRSFKDMELRLPDVLPASSKGPCRALNLDANEAAREAESHIAYLDPPYNQHSYLSNYHIWESLVRWDKPEVYGVACKRVDCRTRKSDYNSKVRHKTCFLDLIGALSSELLVVSFSNEGYQQRSELESILATRGAVFVIEKGYKRYVGASIGIYNPSGEKVGKVSHLRNREYTYVVATPELVKRCPDALVRLRMLSDDLNEAEAV
jgi:adenine-specific DNA-methyltransferase